MNLLDIARVVLDRVWKPVSIAIAVFAILAAITVSAGFAATIGLILFALVFGLFWFHGAAIYSLLQMHALFLANKLRSKWGPFYEDVTGELKAIADARAELRAAQDRRKAGQNTLKEARKQAKNCAKKAAKALEEQLIAASLGENATDLTTKAIVAREAAETWVAVSRTAKTVSEQRIAAVKEAEQKLRTASQTYRASKSEKPVTSA